MLGGGDDEEGEISLCFMDARTDGRTGPIQGNKEDEADVAIVETSDPFHANINVTSSVVVKVTVHKN